jgi:ATP-dependent exoDNAse (exonuclease V) alpha subunit
LKGRITGIDDQAFRVRFTVSVEIILEKREVESYRGLEFIRNNSGETEMAFWVNVRPPYSSDKDSDNLDHIMPFQVAYAVSIHKSQGLEYDSVKIVIADDSEDKIEHNIFYTAITRAKKHLTIYWSEEVCNKILAEIKPKNNERDFHLLKTKHKLA